MDLLNSPVPQQAVLVSWPTSSSGRRRRVVSRHLDTGGLPGGLPESDFQPLTQLERITQYFNSVQLKISHISHSDSAEKNHMRFHTLIQLKQTTISHFDSAEKNQIIFHFDSGEKSHISHFNSAERNHIIFHFDSAEKISYFTV